MFVMVKAMKNPRSALCKTSIMASADIFCAFGHLLLSSFSPEAFDLLVHIKDILVINVYIGGLYGG